MRYFKILKNFFKKNTLSPEMDHQLEEEHDIANDENYISESSAVIEIRLDAETSDFNVVVSIDDMSKDCSENLGLILYMLNSGHLNEYFTQAYNSWSSDDPERKMFIRQLFLSWIKNKEIYSPTKEKLAIKPSEVFNFSDYLQN